VVSTETDCGTLLWGCSKESMRDSVTKKPQGKAYGRLRAFLTSPAKRRIFHFRLPLPGMVCSDFSILSCPEGRRRTESRPCVSHAVGFGPRKQSLVRLKATRWSCGSKQLRSRGKKPLHPTNSLALYCTWKGFDRAPHNLHELAKM
jgi:hypothetical protein